MRRCAISTLAVFIVAASWFFSFSVLAATPSQSILKAKKDAEAKGYVFYESRDEIVAKAKQEGKLRVLAEMEPPTIKASIKAFAKKYPFINLHIEEITGTDSARRNILEIKSGMAKDWDILHLSTDFYNEYLPHLWKVDILGMAEQGVLQIPPAMVDPKHRNVVGFYSRFQVTVYNKKLFAADKLPKFWDDILKPEFKGKKFAADIRPTEIAALVPAWGLEKTLDFARKVAAQEPIWVRGGSRTITAIIAGEIPMMIGPNFHTTKRAQGKDVTGNLQYVALEPVPLRLSSRKQCRPAPKTPTRLFSGSNGWRAPKRRNWPMNTSLQARRSMFAAAPLSKSCAARNFPLSAGRIINRWSNGRPRSLRRTDFPKRKQKNSNITAKKKVRVHDSSSSSRSKRSSR